ncbi:16S rRNA (uracil(1498)-N(3))-methyltransferase [Herbivorax sp. ANBcel31]|uniref:16S rRNA (uracil(1498)-N(3))-methyltransferase n=1 Tax=Herbivorax sp. ANBcel31 TaxID=3069754 RepID=UPI0027B5372E|nr:16S rRNA (uracil(1498)-N(3))-methyltransferase [Herbivorax sp. ANBcel31]MDQ2084991.1 16S rRNA (uracil(1498)-N(3))-methyltransferase [Herbivorax sp. ANBcel31]
MSRFFVNGENIFPDSIDITGEDVVHIKKVLRLKNGDNITVSDGMGTDYYVKIEKIDSDKVTTKIINSEKNKSEPSVNITLFQALPKSDKMDFIIQKGVELGAKKIVPVITERTVVKISKNKDYKKKHQRWNRISMEAAKQCKRGRVPQIEYPMTFKDAIDSLTDESLKILPYEKEKSIKMKRILSNKSNIKDIFIFIGPEGGFSDNEIELAFNSSVSTVSLGPRILRTETAGIVVLSILMYELGDVGNG